MFYRLLLAYLPLRPAAPDGAAPAELEAERLRDVRFSLIYRQSTQREIIDPIFEAAGIRPNLFLETASNRANVSMVQKGLCCSIVPSYYARDLKNAVCFHLPGRPCWTVAAACRQDRYLSKAARSFIDLAKSYFQQEESALQEDFSNEQNL